MKIAMFTDYFYPELGGIQDSIATIARSLGCRGHRVDIHAPRYGARDYRRIGAIERERDLGTNVRVIRRMSLPFPSSTRQSRAALPSPVVLASLAFGEKPDVIHTHSFFSVGLEALLASAWLGVPVIGTNHTTVAGFGPHIPIGVERAMNYVMWYYNRCAHVTAPSRFVFDEPGFGRLKRPRDVVSNPIDTDLFRPGSKGQKKAARARFGLLNPTITYAGRLGPEKNVAVLLHAIAALRDRGIAADLAIAGHGSHEPVLRDLAVRLRIVPHVHFLGTLPPGDLVELLRASEIFVMPSTSETQSMVLLQAMACAIPVVAANSRALPEFAGPENGALADPNDPADFARIFANLLEAPVTRQAMGMEGRRLAEKYGTEIVTSRWEAIYQFMQTGEQAREHANGDQFRRAGI